MNLMKQNQYSLDNHYLQPLRNTDPLVLPPGIMHSDAFDVIPYEDIQGDWKKLGSGSFGNVYKGTYLGLDVAIKEVLPSTEYDVSKYFEREWRLMKECRHPNIATYMGLSRAPAPDSRIFIVSEFIDNGNLRSYIHDKSKPLPWRLRLSFATDIARALAYLHARKCLHRDLKGENLLVTSNCRLKITDFGFARISPRNEDEIKRLTFCGTDSYMSPEILMGDEFDLSTDIFSLGIIFCELACRKLAGDNTFKRTPPTFGIDAEEVHQLASKGCPPQFIALCLDCLAEVPSNRPNIRVILERLRQIEGEVFMRPDEVNENVGSIKFITGGRRPGAGPRIPSFGMGVGKDIRNTDESDDELMEAVLGLSSIGIPGQTEWDDASLTGREPLLNGRPSDYSIAVVKSQSQTSHNVPPSLSSILTIRPSPDPNCTPDPLPSDPAGVTDSLLSIATMDSYHTASGSSSIISSALATEGGSTIRSAQGAVDVPLVHRFTLIKPGAKPKRTSGAGTISPSQSTQEIGWNPLDLFFSSGLLVAKCDICTKRLGWKPVFECDDCGLRTHIKCGEVAPYDCGLRPSRQTHTQIPVAISPATKAVKHSSKATSPERK
jgi:LIM domain kinase 1